MRFNLRSVGVVALVAGVAIACGSSSDSTFDGGTGEDGGTVEQPPGSLIGDDGGLPPPPTCKPLTCADAKANCGPIGDGCGGVVECGTCDAASGETCGGGGVPSTCGKPACTKLTCADQGANCGAAADGCGGIIPTCGTCDTNAGEYCGGGGNSKCGLGTTGGDGGAGDGGTVCTPKTCVELGVTCGPAADGCGGIIPNCGTCDALKGETCGGAGVPSQCGKACVPKTTCAAGQNCGPIADGCGGIISCGGPCPSGQACGSGNPAVPNVCGSSSNCTTGLCTQQVTCDGGGTTVLSGRVTSPNGTLPIYGATVFVPNAPVAPFAPGVACEQCGAGSAANALVVTTTNANGEFFLPNVPVSSNAVGKVMDIPVVIQLGRWRKQFTVQTTACTTNNATAAQTALPKNKSEGDIPLTAIVTGQVDGLECVFRKIGIDDAEFTDPSGNGRIRFYQDNGAVITANAGTCSGSGASCNNFGGNCTSTCSGNGASCTTVGATCGYCSGDPSRTCTTIGAACNGNRGTCTSGGTCTSNGVCNQTAGTPPATALYNSPAELAKYDISLFECVGGRQDKTPTQQANVIDYANKGGRVYATHFSYVWLYNAGASPWNSTASWVPDSHSWNTAVATVDQSFPKGVAFAQWLSQVGALSTALPNAKITITESRHDVDAPVVAPAQRWLYTTAADTPNIPSVQHYTFNTDWTKPADQQCGRVLFSDFHVSTGSNTTNVVFPNECDNNPLTAQEKVLAFMLFDLASCVAGTPPQPATCTPKNCVQQGIECGQGGDGCGNIINCPDCTGGLTCGGGGQPSKCGKPPCTPKTCAAGQCGTIADGCGGTAVCAPCAPGTTCGGGGTPNVCGVGTCTPSMCPTPAPNSACGPVANGCGGINQCSCPPNTPCVNGKCGTPPCTPRDCTAAGANCGQVADGCGNLLNCGTCLAPQTCGGGGTANVCGGGVN